MSRAAFFLLLVVVVAVPALPAQTGNRMPTPPERGLVPASAAFNPQDCKACHDPAVFERLERTHHAGMSQSCANCHGNVAEHAATGDPSLVISFKSLQPKQQNEVCLSCHERGEQANWHGGMHDRRKLTCVTCHSVHDFESTSSQLRASSDQAVCYTCHANVRAQTMRTSHHPIREGKMGCADCHNPHGSPTPKMIRAASVNDQCFECHAEMRGPFLWEHAPVRENCVSCHNAHGSNHERLLVARQPFLCQRCHLATRHPGTLYDFRNSSLGPSPSNRAVERSCRNCHTQVHGSNHPSGAYLGR